MNIYAATAILFLSSAQAQQIQSPTAALTTFVPTEGSNDELVVVEELQPMSWSMSIHNTAQFIEAFGYDSKSSKTGGHGYGGYGGYDSKSAKKGSGGYGYGYGGHDTKSDKGYGSAKSDKGGYGYDSKSAKGSGYSSGSGSAKGGKTGGSGYGGYGDGGYGAAIEAPLQQSTFEIEETKGGYGAYDAKSAKKGSGYGDSKSDKGYGSAKSDKGGYSAAASAVEVEETSEPDVPDVDKIVGYLSSLLAELLDVEGQADAVKPAAFDIGAIYDIIEHFLNGYGSKSSKSKSGKRF